MKNAPTGTRVVLDTMIFIYHLEDYLRYSDLTGNLFSEIETGRYHAVTSSLTLLEILVKPKRERRHRVMSDYRDLLLAFPNLDFVSLDLQASEVAWSIRAEYSLKTPDSIQIATAMVCEAGVLITNDEEIRTVKEIPVMLLGQWK